MLFQKRCYYNLFLWLNLPLSFRKGCFKQFGPKPQPDDEILLNASDEENCPVAEIPRVQKLSLVFLRELLAHKITINHFSNIVLGGKDSFLVRNMLMAPLTWDMTPVKLRKMYGKIWYWMRMPIDQRLKCLGMAPKLQAEEVALAEESCEEEDAIEEPMTDTTIISKVVIQRLTESDMKVSQLAQSLLPGLPPLYLNDYLFNPIDWTTATPHQRYVYAMLNYWLGNEEDLFAGVYLNTRQVASEALRFVKQNGVTISEFADRVVKIPRASVSLYFNNTIEWNASKDYLKHAYVLTAHWLDLPPEARLRGFTSNVTKQQQQPRIENVEVKPDINHDDTENASVVRPEVMAQEAAILQEAKMLLTKKPPKVMSFINTAGVAADMRAEMKRAGVSINGFAGVLGVHRNFLSALLQNPVSWDHASQYQQFAYGAMKQWLLFRQGQVVVGQQNSNNALKPINGPFHSKRVKQQRVRFTPEQRRYLSAAFKANPRPSADEKRAIGETLGLPFKTVTIYYSNARSRSSSSAASPY